MRQNSQSRVSLAHEKIFDKRAVDSLMAKYNPAMLQDAKMIKEMRDTIGQLQLRVAQQERFIGQLQQQLDLKRDELEALTVEKGSENENAIDTIRMLETRLDMKDGELQEREAEFKRIYEMTKKVSK